MFLDRIYKIDKIISFSSPIFENANTLFPKSFIEARLAFLIKSEIKL